MTPISRNYFSFFALQLSDLEKILLMEHPIMGKVFGELDLFDNAFLSQGYGSNEGNFLLDNDSRIDCPSYICLSLSDSEARIFLNTYVKFFDAQSPLFQCLENVVEQLNSPTAGHDKCASIAKLAVDWDAFCPSRAEDFPDEEMIRVLEMAMEKSTHVFDTIYLTSTVRGKESQHWIALKGGTLSSSAMHLFEEHCIA